MKPIEIYRPLMVAAAIGATSVVAEAAPKAKSRPNILFAIADDISYPYMSAYGCKTVSTPAFDEVARRGVLFENGYVTSPGSSPSRASILTGKYTWEIEQAGTHGQFFPSHLVTYTDILAQAGYKVGYTGKGWSPGRWTGYRETNPAGPEYNDITTPPPFTGINSYDYFENFKAFMQEREKEDKGEPFCFWYGGKEAHRGYENGSWKKAGKRLEDAVVPGYLPDNEVIRGDIMDFAVEVEWFDSHLGKILRYLEAAGELDNTFIIVTADNGMPFPSSKATCYDAGTHVPMAICMGDKFKRKAPETTPVSSIDFAATILDVTGVAGAEKMTSRSLLPWLEGKRGAKLPAFVAAAREGHAYARYEGKVYPVRDIRIGDWLYVHNFEPDRWPAGDPLTYPAPKKGAKPQEPKLVAGWADIDGSPSKGYLVKNSENPEVKPYFDHAVAKRPEQMLYNLKDDPYCMNNLAQSDKAKCAEMRKALFEKLEETHDSRLVTPEIWDEYAYAESDSRRSFPKPKR